MSRKRKYRRMGFARAEADGWRCHYCDKPLDETTLTADHVKPQSKGGSDKYANIVPACKPCNNHKRSLSVAEFAELRSRPKRREHNHGGFRYPRLEVWNPNNNQWVNIGSQNRDHLTKELVEGGKYVFRGI